MVSGESESSNLLPNAIQSPVKFENEPTADEDTIFLSNCNDTPSSSSRFTRIQTRSRSSGNRSSKKGSVINYNQKQRSYISATCKLRMLRLLDSGRVTRKQLCDRLGVQDTTISIWIRKRSTLVKSAETPQGKPGISLYSRLEDKLLKWIDQAMDNNSCAIIGDVIKQKANEIASELGITNFDSNPRWLLLFQTRHNIKFDRSIVKMEPSIRVNILRSLIDSEVEDPNEIGFIEIKQEDDDDNWTGVDLNESRINENTTMRLLNASPMNENDRVARVKREQFISYGRSSTSTQFTNELLHKLNNMTSVRCQAVIRLLKTVTSESNGWDLEQITQFTENLPFS